VLKRICGTERKKAAVSYRRMHNNELGNLYASLNDFMAVKSRMMK
jgi:hypothetical protein